jgi:hypothetical protein
VKSTIAVLDIGEMNNDAQQETQRVEQDVPLATFDLLARAVPNSEFEIVVHHALRR